MWASIGLAIYTYTAFIVCTLLTLDFIDAMQFIAIHTTIVCGIGYLYSMYILGEGQENARKKSN